MASINKIGNGHYEVQEYFTAKELADKLQLNVMTIYRWIDSGKLKAYKPFKEFRIDKTEFDRFMNSTRTK